MVPKAERALLSDMHDLSIATRGVVAGSAIGDHHLLRGLSAEDKRRHALTVHGKTFRVTDITSDTKVLIAPVSGIVGSGYRERNVGIDLLAPDGEELYMGTTISGVARLNGKKYSTRPGVAMPLILRDSQGRRQGVIERARYGRSSLVIAGVVESVKDLVLKPEEREAIPDPDRIVNLLAEWDELTKGLSATREETKLDEGVEALLHLVGNR
jgi:hypothetical protein